MRLCDPRTGVTMRIFIGHSEWVNFLCIVSAGLLASGPSYVRRFAQTIYISMISKKTFRCMCDAFEDGTVEACDKLLDYDHKSAPDGCILIAAAEKGHLQTCKILLDRGLTISTRQAGPCMYLRLSPTLHNPVRGRIYFPSMTPSATRRVHRTASV